jgi:predicted alpha/beta hydrolase family esterase
MFGHAVGEPIEELRTLALRLDFVLVPGFKDSGPEHWQSCWQRRTPVFQRIAQRSWDQPDIERWVDAIVRLLAPGGRPAVLIGHSLGALAAACVAGDGHKRVAGLMLVAPAEPMRFEAEGRVPERSLGMPALVVASEDDRVMSLRRAKHWARIWGADLVDLGEAGHINAEAGFGPWPHGLHLLAELARRI